MGVGRRLRPLALVALISATSAGGVAAQEDVCASLQARLTVLDRQTQDAWNGGSAEIDSAIDRQRAALDDAGAVARQSGCLGGFLAPRTQAGDCRAITARIGRIQADLNRLNARKRRLAADPYGSEQERAGVVRAMAENGCGDGFTVYGASSGGRRGHGLFETILGNGRARAVWGPADYGANDFNYGTYRTLCVRTCDGYYFPISFATVAGRFASDEQACRASCPGTDVALYVYRNPGEDVDQAMSLAGEPYRSLSTAFRYRKEFDATCRCGAVVASAAPADATSFVTVPPSPMPLATYGGIMPAPEARPPPSEDPETMANRAGGLVPEAARPADTQTAATTFTEDGRQIRVVGSSFYVPRNSRPVSSKPPPAPPDERQKPATN